MNKQIMGYYLSWLAVKGKPPQTVRDALGLRPTGDREEIPEADFTSANPGARAASGTRHKINC
ncbi:MAG TPA: hypothetical protein VGY98_02275 [Verrucomicrobiae bacterium]|nr:hypothetical protein [Verrucomicrobiae bacterium]